MTNMQDKRVGKTLRALCTALLEISSMKPFSKISIRDLCEHANINRSTFYAHFEDKYQLLTYLLTQISHECTAGLLDAGEQPLLVLMGNSGYRDLYAEVLGNEELTKLLHQFIVEDVKDQLKKQKVNGDPLEREITAECYAGAVVSLLSWWIRKGADIPLTHLTHYLSPLPSPFEEKE